MAHKRWLHTTDELVSNERGIDGQVLRIPHPFKLARWVDDMRLWPAVSYVDIINYFVLSEGVDGEELRNYKSTEAYNYFHSNKVGRVLVHTHGNYVFLKAEVERSQSISQAKHSAWAMVQQGGVVETVGCACIAGLGRSCSHAAAVLWKVWIYCCSIYFPCTNYK